MLQEAIVTLIVLLAFGWAAWYWMPAPWRRKLAAALGRGGMRVGLGESGADRIARAVADAPGCSSCDSCGSCATPGKPGSGGTQAGERKTVRIFPSH
ncbi:hypothetical protein GT347_08705 [Xylophilus rhododendri]|uniref:Uncharacterized protein n=1 Tax=Xylophilus rhododendri TaxID=2697032 RepID=A0A857J5F2_9BURK|nr:DUF6587 family protein [Xylophilus rhododendri]QHI98068.1 hypothetical protein GT347_08705 [Xylophilus rhododendri]